MYHIHGDLWIVDITGEKIALVFVTGMVHINMTMISIFWDMTALYWE